VNHRLVLILFAHADDIVYADVNPLPTFAAGVSNLTVTSGDVTTIHSSLSLLPNKLERLEIS
jgi:hypothetical protein